MNVAIGGQSSHSSRSNRTNAGGSQQALDGNYSTYYRSDDTPDQWMTVDLGRVLYINRIKVYHAQKLRQLFKL